MPRPKGSKNLHPIPALNCKRCGVLTAREHLIHYPESTGHYYCNPCFALRKNRYTIDGDICRVYFVDGNFTVIDTEDAERVLEKKWHTIKAGSSWYAATSVPGSTAPLMLHRFLVGTPDGMDTDHINCDKLDNRKCNLRVCTRSQNNVNRPHPRRDNTSGYSGICWSNREKRWRTYITVKGKQIGLGYFKDLDKAIEARSHALKKHYGEFAPQASWKSYR